MLPTLIISLRSFRSSQLLQVCDELGILVLMVVMYRLDRERVFWVSFAIL